MTIFEEIEAAQLKSWEAMRDIWERHLAPSQIEIVQSMCATAWSDGAIHATTRAQRFNVVKPTTGELP